MDTDVTNISQQVVDLISSNIRLGNRYDSVRRYLDNDHTFLGEGRHTRSYVISQISRKYVVLTYSDSIKRQMNFIENVNPVYKPIFAPSLVITEPYLYIQEKLSVGNVTEDTLFELADGSLRTIKGIMDDINITDVDCGYNCGWNSRLNVPQIYDFGFPD